MSHYRRNSWCAQLSRCHFGGKGLVSLAMAATKGLLDHLFMATCEWFLMFWLFIDATLAYSLTKFARYCELQIPCLLCSRLDHFFGNEEPGSYFDLFCNKHQVDISYMIYCNLHNELVDVRETCEDCFNSVTFLSESNLESYGFVVGTEGKEREGCRRSYLNKHSLCVPSSLRTCSCCERRWKAKSIGEGLIHPNAVGSRGSKVTTKPPLPRVSRRGRSRHDDNLKRMRNRIKHRRRDASSPVGYSDFKVNSDSEFEFLFSDDEDGSLYMFGIGDRSSNNDSMFRGRANGGNRYKSLGRHSHSTPDLRTALLLEAQLNEISRHRSASLTPKCSLRKTKESCPKKAEKHKKPLSSSTNARSCFSTASLDRHNPVGNQNRSNIFSRHSFSASDLGSALLLEMHLNSLPRRAASLTPNRTYGYGLGEHEWPRFQSRPTSSRSAEPSSLDSFLFHLQKDVRSVPSRTKKNKKSSSSTPYYMDKTNGQGHLDDIVISRNTGGHNRNKIPRRHSYSVFQLGGDILLNMPQDENLTSFSASLAPNGYVPHSPELGSLNPMSFPLHRFSSSSDVRSDLSNAYINKTKGYGSFDDSSVQRTTGSQYQNNLPRRHSYSFFEMGCEILLNMPGDESLTSRSPSLAPNGSIGYGFGEPKKSKLPTRPNVMQLPDRKSRRDKTNRHGFLDDSVISSNTGNHNENKNPRRHSYSAFELGCALLLEMHKDESLTRRPAYLAPNGHMVHGSGEQKSKCEARPCSSRLPGCQFPIHKTQKDSSLLDKAKRHGSLDDSVVSRSTGQDTGQDQNKIPRRHSYSAFELGCALLLEMHLNESLSNPSASLAPNGSHASELGSLNTAQFHHQKAKKDKKQLPLPNSINGLGSSSLDDSVVSRNTNSRNQSTIPRRHSYSVFQLGGDILLNMPIDESLTNRSASLVPDKNPLPPTSSSKRINSSSDEFLDETKWCGSLDDLVISRRSMVSHNQNEVPRRHSYSAFDLGRALLVEMHLDESLKRSYAPTQPHNVAKIHHRKAKRDKQPLPLPNSVKGLGSSSNLRTQGHRSLDDSFVPHNTCSHNHPQNPRRHSYSAFELGCALLLDMQRDSSLTRRSASVTPSSINHGLEQLKNPKIQTNHGSLNAHFAHQRAEESHLPPLIPIQGSVYKLQGDGSFDDSFVSHDVNSRKRYRNLVRNSYSASDLTSPLILEMHLDESLQSRSASLTPNCSIGEGLGDFNWLKFQTGPSSSRSPEFSYLDDMQPLRKRKKVDRSKAKKSKKTLPSANNVKVTSSSTNRYGFFEESVVSNNMDSQSRCKIFARNSQSAADLGSAYLLEMHLDDSVRSRSKSLTPNCSIEHGLGEDKWSKSQTKPSPRSPDSLTDVQNDPPDEKDKKTLPSIRDTDSLTNIRSDLCPACLDKIDVRSFDGSSVFSEMETEAGIVKVKKQAEDDVRCMRLLQSELEAERNAATVAANHAMNMITRLQQEKASLQMEALQYLRMMEEQAEYDMEALQKANELVEEKENEIQDLLDELEHYRIKYGDESTRNMPVPVTNLDDEKRYILESLSKLEMKLHQLSTRHISNGNTNSLPTHKDSQISNGVLEKSQENEIRDDSSKRMVSKDGVEVDLATLEHEILDMKAKMEALQADVELLKHACNTLHGNEGLDFIEEIAHQLQDLRMIMFDGRYTSSN